MQCQISQYMVAPIRPKPHIFKKNFVIIEALLYSPPQGRIWHTRVDPWCTLSYQISYKAEGRKIPSITAFSNSTFCGGAT